MSRIPSEPSRPLPTRSAEMEALPSALRREAGDDVPANLSGNPTIGDVVAARYDRRDLIRGVLGVAAIAAVASPLALAASRPARAEGPVAGAKPAACPDPEAAALKAPDRFPFTELTAPPDTTHHVAPGHRADVLIRWGDPVLPDAPPFDPHRQTAEAQARQFGYNNDFLGFIPLPPTAAGESRGLLVANHEYTNEELMFPGIGVQEAKAGFPGMTLDKVDVEMAAHGGSVLEIVLRDGVWRVVPNSSYARRITAETLMEIAGPAAGDARLKTNADPSGRKVHGMINNCAGGITPWGTWLTCEENFNYYFSGKRDGLTDADALKAYGVPGNEFAWGKFHDRFNVNKEPNEPNRFGWVVEIDPFDPRSTPKKRTALGRFKHEGAANIVNGDGRFVVYQGDDQMMEHVYRFVTDARVDRANPAANRDILDAGTLSVAVFNADGTGEWRPLVHGAGPLNEASGFKSQADVLIHARLAAAALGATKMDRPEDVEVSPKTGKVYVMLTANKRRTEAEVDAANPRANNAFGHIIEITPEGGDHAAPRFSWEILVKCGDPCITEVGASFSPATSKAGWFANPDNCAVDSEGRLWVATDGNSAGGTGRTDGIFGVETEGPRRGTSKRFFSVPLGAEMCGPYFTPDDTAFFVAVQHPGESEDGILSTFDYPTTRWPDFKDGMPPRPSVVVITRTGGGKVGT